MWAVETAMEVKMRIVLNCILVILYGITLGIVLGIGIDGKIDTNTLRVYCSLLAFFLVKEVVLIVKGIVNE